MKLSNRVLGILILLGFILSFYGFYKYFFKLNLINIEINSNVSNFSGSLTNTKFTKDFACKEKKCVLEGIPPFEYDIIISKDSYKTYMSNIKANVQKIYISLEKDIKIEEIESKKISREELIKNIKDINNNKINFSGSKITGNKIIGNDTFVYFMDEGKLYLYNLYNNNSFGLDFVPKIKYIKSISENDFIIVTGIGSFTYNILNKKIEYFSLFSDFILLENNYIGIINSEDITRKKNFGFENHSGNLIISYDIKNKEFYIIEDISYLINKIYIEKNIIYIENNDGAKFKITGY